MKTTITNTVGTPFDIQTLSGPAIITAFGELTAEFDPAYLELLLACASIVLAEDQTEPVTASGEPEAATVSPELDASVAVEGTTAADDDAESADPEVDVAADAGQPETGEQEAPQAVAEQTPAEKYKELTGKKPDGRWSEKRLAAELAKLKG